MPILHKDVDNALKVYAVTRANNRQKTRRDSQRPMSDMLPACDSSDVIWSNDYLSNEQKTDPNIAIIHEYLLNGTEITKEQYENSDELYHYYLQRDALFISDGIIYRKFFNETGKVSKTQFLCPKSIRHILLKRIHDFELAHRRTVAVNVQKLLDIAYWKSYRSDMENYVKSCVRCLEAHSRKEVRHGTISNTVRVTGPNQILAYDFRAPM